MFEAIRKKLKQLTAERKPIDPARFNDPIALQTDWSPAKGGGANFRTHKLIRVDSNRFEYRASLGAVVFYWIFILVGCGTMVGSVYVQFSSHGSSLGFAILFPVVFGLVFFIIGVFMLKRGTTPAVFDRKEGAFWKGSKIPEGVRTGTESQDYARFDEVHALQLISELCRSDDSNYYSYEMNLVLKDGRRINVVDHGNPDRIRQNAQTLSGFLGKPVWDAI